MNSWYQAMLLAMAKGQYLHLGQRSLTQYDWLTLWILAQEEQARADAQ